MTRAGDNFVLALKRGDAPGATHRARRPVSESVGHHDGEPFVAQPPVPVVAADLFAWIRELDRADFVARNAARPRPVRSRQTRAMATVPVGAV